MAERVDADLRTLRVDLADQFRVAGHLRPDHEERAGNLVLARAPRGSVASTPGRARRRRSTRRCRRQGDALPSAVGQVDHRAARAHRGGHRGVVAVLAASRGRSRSASGRARSAAARCRTWRRPVRSTGTSGVLDHGGGGGGGVVVPHQPERHRDAPPVRADEDVRSVESEAPVRAFDDDVTIFGAVVTAFWVRSSAPSSARPWAPRCCGRRPLATPAQSGAAAATGAGCAGTGTSSAPCGRPAVSTRTPPCGTRRWADRQRPHRRAGEADADHAEVGQAGQRDQPAEAGDELAAPPRCVHEDGHDRCRDQLRR